MARSDPNAEMYRHPSPRRVGSSSRVARRSSADRASAFSAEEGKVPAPTLRKFGPMDAPRLNLSKVNLPSWHDQIGEAAQG